MKQKYRRAHLLFISFVLLPFGLVSIFFHIFSPTQFLVTDWNRLGKDEMELQHIHSSVVNNSVPNYIFSENESKFILTQPDSILESDKFKSGSNRSKRGVKRSSIKRRGGSIKRGMKGGKGGGMDYDGFKDKMKDDMKKLMKMKMKLKKMKKKKKMMILKSMMKKIPKKEKCDKKGIKLVKIQRIEYKKVPMPVPHEEVGRMYEPVSSPESETSFGWKKNHNFKYPLPEAEEFMKKDYKYNYNYGDDYGGGGDVVYTGDYYSGLADYGGNPAVNPSG